MSSDDSATLRSAHALPHTTYALLLAGAFLVYASANAVVPVASELRASLGLAADGGAALFLGPFAVGFGVGCFAWFAVARHGRPRVLLPVALAVAAAGAVPLVMVDEPWVAVAARALTGLGAAGFPAVAQGVIAAGVPEAVRGRMIGGFVMAVVAGSFAGQAIVGALADAASVDVALAVVCVVAPSAAAVALWRVLPRGRAATAGGEHVPVGPMLARQWPVLAVALLAFAGYWLLLGELPVVLREERYGLGAAAAGALPMVGLLGLVAAWITGRVSDRRAQRLPMTATLLVGSAALALTFASGTPLWLFAVAYGVFLAAYWGYLPPASAEVAARARGAERQPALMAFYAAMWAGAALAPAVGALVSGWAAAGVLVLCAWLVAALIATTTFTHRAGGAHAAGAPVMADERSAP